MPAILLGAFMSAAAPLTDADLARLAAGLPTPGQGWACGQMETADEYARACAQTGDPRFRDKAVGLIRTLGNYQKAWFDGLVAVARGDGAARTFPLDPAPVGDVLVRVAAPETAVVTRGAGDTDPVAYYAHFLGVRNGAGEYARGTDWTRSGDDPGNEIRWVGRRPAAGAAYAVEYASRLDGPVVRRPAGPAVTLDAPPAAGAVVFAQYVYHGDLQYQETVTGLGGLNCLYVDDGYGTRALGFAFRAAARLATDPAFPADVRALLANFGPRAADYIRDRAYRTLSGCSNYGAGHLWCRAEIGLYLAAVGHPDAGRVLAETADRWRALVPRLVAMGPFWCEGWNYGDQAARKWLDASLRLEAAGLIDAAPVKSWAAAVAEHLACASPDGGRTVYDGGDWFDVYPSPFPRTLADSLTANGFPPPADPPADHYCPGTGLVVSRGGAGDVVFCQAGPNLDADHQSYTPGQLEIVAGGVPLLANGAVRLHDQSGYPKSQWGNVWRIDCPDRSLQTYPRAMGGWYDGRKFVTAHTSGPVAAVRANAGAAWSPPSAPDSGGPCEFWARDVWHRKATGTVVVYDRAGVRGDWPHGPQWCLAASPIDDGDGWYKATAGGQTLYVKAFPVASTLTPAVADAPVAFLRYAAADRRAQVATVFGVNRKPAVTLAGYTLTVDGEPIALDPDWPAPLTPPGPAPMPSAAVTFVRRDDTTQGNWKGTYGADGAVVVGDGARLPAGLTVTPAGKTDYTFAANPADPRAPLRLDSDARVAASWYAAGSFTVDIGTDAPRRVALYLVDWPGATIAARVEAVDPATGASLHAQDATGLHGGSYLVYDLSAGRARFRLTRLAGPDVDVFGVFADGAAPPPPPPAPAVTEEYRYAGPWDAAGRRVVTVYERRA